MVPGCGGAPQPSSRAQFYALLFAEPERFEGAFGLFDLATLVWTRGRAFPISRLESRLRCPHCGSREVTLIFSLPTNANVASGRARLAARKGRYSVAPSSSPGTAATAMSQWSSDLKGPRQNAHQLHDRCDVRCPDLPKVL